MHRSCVPLLTEWCAAISLLLAAQGFFLKAGALPQQSWVTVADAAEVTVQAQVAQTVGMRTLFFFPVTVRRFLMLCCCSILRLRPEGATPCRVWLC